MNVQLRVTAVGIQAARCTVSAMKWCLSQNQQKGVTAGGLPTTAYIMVMISSNGSWVFGQVTVQLSMRYLCHHITAAHAPHSLVVIRQCHSQIPSQHYDNVHQCSDSAKCRRPITGTLNAAPHIGAQPAIPEQPSACYHSVFSGAHYSPHPKRQQSSS